MVKSASEEYGYVNDDILIDALSSLSNMACNIGEIIGPLFTGVVADVIGLENTGVIVALSCFVYGIIYFFGSGLLGFYTQKNKQIALSMKMIIPE